MIDVAFAIPGNIDTPTGGYAYARKVMALLPDYGVTAHHIPLPGSYPRPDADDLDATLALFAQIAPETVLLIDGLAFGAMPGAMVAKICQPIVALCHHPLACETGLSPADQQKFHELETEALAHARKVIVSSRQTADVLARNYAVPPDRITVAEPGTNPALRSPPGAAGAPVRLFSVGAMIPRKGYDVLISALASIDLPDWRMTIVGATDRDPDHATLIREHILRSGLRSRIILAGEVSDRDLQKAYVEADIFVMPSHYEGYGMVLSEAIARGLPIVSTTGGALAQTAPDDVALKVPPGDPAALADALRTMISDRDVRLSRAEKAWAAARVLPRWSTTAERIARALIDLNDHSHREQSARPMP